MKIELSKNVIVYENPWIQVCFDHVTCRNEKITRYTKIIESKGNSGVAILPILKYHIGLVKVFRYPLGMELLEIPRGFGESKNPAIDAKRELHEETGISSCEIISLGHIYPNSGLLTNKVNLFAAICNEEDRDTKPIDDEITSFEWIEIEKIEEMLSVEITDAFTLCAFLRAKTKGLLDIAT